MISYIKLSYKDKINLYYDREGMEKSFKHAKRTSINYANHTTHMKEKVMKIIIE